MLGLSPKIVMEGRWRPEKKEIEVHPSQAVRLSGQAVLLF